MQIPPAEPYADAFHWCAIYDDDGEDILDEHEEDGTPHTFAEIDQSRLNAFMLIPQRDDLAPIALHLEEGQRLIFFRRTAIATSGPMAGLPRKAHVIGTQDTVRGQNVQRLLAVFDNGACLFCSDQSLIQP